MDKNQRVAIVGIGGIFPGASDLDTFWENILAARDCSREPPAGRWLLSLDDVYDPDGPKADKVYSKRACFVDGFTLDRTDLAIEEELLDSLDPMFHLLLHAGKQAWQDGVTTGLDKGRVGVIIGNIALPTDTSSAIADELLLPVFEQQITGKTTGTKSTNKLNRYVAGLPAGLLARALGLGKGSYTLDAACASSLYSLKYAVEELQAGRADAMLCGGLSRPDSLYTQMGFSALHAISASGRCSPFDQKGDGLVVGEGSGILMLKRLDDALEAGDHIYATIAGIGLSNDIGGNLMSPDSEGQCRAMHTAYTQAGWQASDVDLIECHGTGTPVGDVVEFNSLKKLWGEQKNTKDSVIGSVKSNIGHLLTAAGSAGLIKVLLSMQHAKLPPTANFESPSTNIDLDSSPFTVLSSPQEWERRAPSTPRRAAISAFGFGGINAHVLLEEWDEKHSSSTIAASVSSCNEIAIVGMEAHFGPWSSLESFKHRVFGGDDDVEPLIADNTWGVNSEVKSYGVDDVEIPLGRFRIPPNELKDMLPQQLLMLQVAANALEDAGIKGDKESVLKSAGVYVGIGLDLNTTNFHVRWALLNKAREWASKLGLPLTEEDLNLWVNELRDASGPHLSANRTMGALGGIVASRIARAFNIGGPSFTLSNEESSGLRAIEAGIRALQRGEIDSAIVGAVDLAGDIRSLASVAEKQTIGEGAAAVILKRYEDAVREGDRIYSVIKGTGDGTGGSTSELNPDVDSYQNAISRSLEDAKVDLDSIAYVETQGSNHVNGSDYEAEALALLYQDVKKEIPTALGSIKTDIGHAGAAAGLASIIKSSLCLYNQTLPALRNPEEFSTSSGINAEAVFTPKHAQYWLRNRAEGPRRALVNSLSVDGNCISTVLEEVERKDIVSTIVKSDPAVLFPVYGNGKDALIESLQDLTKLVQESASLDVTALSHKWWQQSRELRDTKLAISLIALDRAHLLELLDNAVVHVKKDEAVQEEFLFYKPEPLGDSAKVAFVFPGSSSHFAGMGQELSARWPEVLNKLDEENETLASQFARLHFWTHKDVSKMTHEDYIFGQVWLGTMVSDVIASFNVKPNAVIGHSLGESVGLFATRTWRDRDLMLQRMRETDLFTKQLAGPCEAVKKAWNTDPEENIDWILGVVDRSGDELTEALKARSRVYLLIINTPKECVIGGDRQAVMDLLEELKCGFHPLEGVTTVHCEVAKAVEKAYRDLHVFDTTPPEGVTFYSGANGGSIDITSNSAADSIVQQALKTFDYTELINAAYADGVRIFIEMGPGASCSRMIRQILSGKPHVAHSACVKGQSDIINVLRILGQLTTERIPLDLSSLYSNVESIAPYAEHDKIVVPVGKKAFKVPQPTQKSRVPDPESKASSTAEVITHPAVVKHGDPMTEIIQQMAATEVARAEAQETFLRVSNGISETLAQALSTQMSLLQSGNGTTGELFNFDLPAAPPIAAPEPQFNREMCMEFAIGSIGKMLGSKFAEVDSYPTRVRLPDEPLMLVDRIMEVEGEACSMSSGRVVTEHDVLQGAWYLDGGRIPTCIAVEAGQADLFLSGYLGIDLQTKGLAVYRLLDAEVTFHGPLPQPGQTIHYDIRIEHFFRQGDTYLFRFNFDGTVDGQPLITMRKGCAGFFTQAELDAGKGIVQTSLETQVMPGKRPHDWIDPVPMVSESYSDAQLNALREGKLAACFGDAFSGLPLSNPAGLPGGRMILVHRILELDPQGGRFGMGMITGEADIHPDDWFLTCHFVDDQVMPGTLMYECCLHTLRVYLLRMGWVGEADEFVYEPMLEVSGKLKCRGQVIHTTKKVQYQITLKEIGYLDDGTPYVIADALMYADGRAVVQMGDMSLRLSGLTKKRIASIWEKKNIQDSLPAEQKKVLFDYASINAFAVGKPSAAFGDKYKVFDEERIIARLPGPPFQFLDRIVSIKDCEQWQLAAGGVIEAEYDVPEDAWYFAESRQGTMPFSVLLEVALQPCGWLAAYLGSALTSDIDLSFRNLGGSATQYLPVIAKTGTLTTTVKITSVSSSGGMIIQHYDYEMHCAAGVVYKGNTYFGFFAKDALANQIGIREAQPYEPSEMEKQRGVQFSYPEHAPYPQQMMRMVNEIELFDPLGGPNELGFISGIAHVNPDAWFFKAHFYQDPVWPGSLGLESFLQLLKVVACNHWGGEGEADKLQFETMALNESHSWVYRGQIIPKDSRVTVQAVITELDNDEKLLKADGFLTVDGRIIYQMKDFALKMLQS